MSANGAEDIAISMKPTTIFLSLSIVFNSPK